MAGSARGGCEILAYPGASDVTRKADANLNRACTLQLTWENTNTHTSVKRSARPMDLKKVIMTKP
jgi:hypothetical protein